MAPCADEISEVIDLNVLSAIGLDHRLTAIVTSRRDPAVRSGCRWTI